MTKWLASVQSLKEAHILLPVLPDILDMKQPEKGALGALDIETISQIVDFIAGRCQTSATIGDLPMNADLISTAMMAVAASRASGRHDRADRHRCARAACDRADRRCARRAAGARGCFARAVDRFPRAGGGAGERARVDDGRSGRGQPGRAAAAAAGAGAPRGGAGRRAVTRGSAAFSDRA